MQGDYGIPSALYNSKPAPIHQGDFDASGYSTVYQTSSGFAALADGYSGQSAAASKSAVAFTVGAGSSGIGGFVLLGMILLYLDHRIAR